MLFLISMKLYLTGFKMNSSLKTYELVEEKLSLRVNKRRTNAPLSMDFYNGMHS